MFFLCFLFFERVGQSYFNWSLNSFQTFLTDSNMCCFFPSCNVDFLSLLSKTMILSKEPLWGLNGWSFFMLPVLLWLMMKPYRASKHHPAWNTPRSKMKKKYHHTLQHFGFWITLKPFYNLRDSEEDALSTKVWSEPETNMIVRHSF